MKKYVAYTNIEMEGSGKPRVPYCEYMDTNWTSHPFRQNSPPRVDVEKSALLEKMILISKELSKQIPFLRVDFYESDSKFYRRTYVLYRGFSNFIPDEWDDTLGSWMNLPNTMYAKK